MRSQAGQGAHLRGLEKNLLASSHGYQHNSVPQLLSGSWPAAALDSLPCRLLHMLAYLQKPARESVAMKVYQE